MHITKRIKHNQIRNTIVIGSLTLLLLNLLFMLFPTVPNNTSAATITNTVSTPATLNIKSTVAISFTTDLAMEIIPKSEGNFQTISANLAVSTNNISGYKIYISADHDGKLIASDKTNTATINPVNGSMSQENYKEHFNSWGYTDLTGTNIDKDSATYSAIPNATDSAIYSAEQATGNDIYQLGFAVAINTSLPADRYQGAITISAIANPLEITNLSQLTYMQDMTNDICQNTTDYINQTNYVSKQLIDTRDGKKYWVAKLADGNCWMVQNLNLDLTVSNGNAAAIAIDNSTTTLTNINTDINTSSWNSGTRIAPTDMLTVAPSSTYQHNGAVYAWKMGDVLLTNPSESESCLGADTRTLKAGTLLSTLPAVCSNYFKAITPEMSDNYIATPTSSYDESTNSYDAHYILGNYYNYNAATAGSVPISGSNVGTATSSICPKNWRLPSSNEQQILFTSYDFTNMSTDISGLTTNPLYFVRGGVAYPYTNSFANAGGGSSYWSSNYSNSNNQNYATYATLSDQLQFSFTNHRYHGFSVRCIAR